jgi:hypothetical protein
MKKNTPYIALLLLVFIAYPFVFQTVHIISHDHGFSLMNTSDPGNGQVHFCSPHQNKCEDPARKDNSNNFPLPGQQLVSSPGYSDLEGSHCPLCEHEFAKFSLEKLFHITFTNERVLLVNNYFYRNPSLLYTGNHRLLRAPPPVSLIS